LEGDGAPQRAAEHVVQPLDLVPERAHLAFGDRDSGPVRDQPREDVGPRYAFADRGLQVAAEARRGEIPSPAEAGQSRDPTVELVVHHAQSRRRPRSRREAGASRSNTSSRGSRASVFSAAATPRTSSPRGNTSMSCPSCKTSTSSRSERAHTTREPTTSRRTSAIPSRDGSSRRSVCTHSRILLSPKPAARSLAATRSRTRSAKE